MRLTNLTAAYLCAAAAVVSAETITLQQDLNGYSGCSDTYITRHYAKAAAGYNTAKTITSAYANYNWLGGGW